MPVVNGVQLVTYANSLGGSLSALRDLLRDQFRGLFPGGVHVLPPFPSSADRGFAPLGYDRIDPDFGTWAELEEIARDQPLVLDLMVNHLSRRSPYCLDFLARGRASPWADLFLTLDKVWPEGIVPAADEARIAHRRPGPPYVELIAGGRPERVWATFGAADSSEQLDLDVGSPAARRLFEETLASFAAHGARLVRLDAVGYVAKKAGTSCFFVEPEIWDFLAWIKGVAEGLGIELLPELHAAASPQRKLAEAGFRVYDFALPALVLHSFLEGSSARLAEHLRSCPRRQCTTLDCHDGIPILPDLEGVLGEGEAARVALSCLERGANLSRLPPALRATAGLDVHQVNCTYYDALGRGDEAYLAARAIQLFAPGIPQVYYVGLLAGGNDQEAVGRQGTGRAVNRHDYSLAELEAELERPVVRSLLWLIEFRNTHPAFGGEFAVEAPTESSLVLSWRRPDSGCSLEVDFKVGRARLRRGDGLAAEDLLEKKCI